ncbi:MAG: TM0106 family RecB-like putative nuclease [Nostocaceae cyanobacterium]|nr:TM0106 family RecB-like putative nuclease [Nostocaceae cyanobacterium]
MLINAERLLQYQRCQRRSFLDVHGDKRQRDPIGDLMHKLQQDKIAHHQNVLQQFTHERPNYSQRDLFLAQEKTLELMGWGVECIYQGVLLLNYSPEYTLLSNPDLLIKQPGNSAFGNWIYTPANIELGKRPKREYQIVAAFHAQILAQVLQTEINTAWLMLRGKDDNYPVDVGKWTPMMWEILEELTYSLEQEEPPEVFISRQRCSLCHWYSSCYQVAQSQQHLSLLPGVTPVRYSHLQTLNITTPESLARTHPSELENLPGFDGQIAPKLVLQAQSIIENRPLILPDFSELSSGDNRQEEITLTSSIELYFDIEAQPDLNLNYLLGVLVVDRQANTDKFYSFLAEEPEEEILVWQQFMDLVYQYPQAPIYHFCVYEFDTVKRLAKLYGTPYEEVSPVLDRFIDIYEQLIQNVALPIESYALKAIARWLGFEWRDAEASGAKCIYWYDQWLKTGDRTLLQVIQRYNEDDCRATRNVKDWLVKFFQDEYNGQAVSTTL